MKRDLLDGEEWAEQPEGYLDPAAIYQLEVIHPRQPQRIQYWICIGFGDDGACVRIRIPKDAGDLLIERAKHSSWEQKFPTRCRANDGAPR